MSQRSLALVTMGTFLPKSGEAEYNYTDKLEIEMTDVSYEVELG